MKGFSIFHPGGARPPKQVMVQFIDKLRMKYGVESICKNLPIAPSTYYEMKAREKDPSKAPRRFHEDEFLKQEIQRVWNENWQVYGAHKVWKQLSRGRIFVASRPNQLWVADLTHVATWRGFIYVAFVTDVFSRMIVGWLVSRSMNTDLTLDALGQAIFTRSPEDDLIHHRDRGSQYLSIKYTERLSEAEIAPSVGSVGDSYDNGMAETINGLFEAEVIWKRGPGKTMEEVESATLEWVDWFNNGRILEPIGNIPLKDFGMMYYKEVNASAKAVGLS